MKTHLSLLGLLFILCANVFAQSGTLDSDFSGDGKVTDSFDTGNDDGQSVLIQPDGKILVAGHAYIQGDIDFVVVRYNSDGSHDNSFSTDGMASVNFGASFNDYGSDMVLQSDGKIVVAGHTDGSSSDIDLAMTRFNADGSIDQTFGTQGRTIIDVGSIYDIARGIDISSTGKLVVTGDAWGNAFVAQFNSDGSPDNSFGTNGVVITSIPNVSTYPQDVKCQPDGKIVVAGYYAPDISDIDFMVLRYNSDGSLDNTFSNDGIVNTDIAAGHERGYSFYLHSDGKITVIGISFNKSAMARYNSNGTLDLSLNNSGKLELPGTTDYYTNVIDQQVDGKYIFGGVYRDPNVNLSRAIALMRVNYDGTFDTGFGTNGIVTTTFSGNLDNSCSAIAIQPDLRIVVTGGTGPFSSEHDIATARFLSGLSLGIADLSVNWDVPLVYPNPLKEFETLEYTLTQNETISIELLNMNGQLVTTFVSKGWRTAGKQKEALTLPSSLVPGTYFISLKADNGQQNIQVVKH